MNKRFLCNILVAMCCVSVFAQSGTNSPYSQYGLGVLSDQSQGFSRGMNGVGLALRKGNIVNTLNPASYSAIDSLTMIFDVGLSGQLTNFKEGGASINARNADFEYAVGCFRLVRNVGVSFGVLPLTNVGYSYSSSTILDQDRGTIAETYSGSGGLHQVFVGAGWRILKPLSLGFNAQYIWGNYDRSIVSSTGTDINSLKKVYSTSAKTFHFDFGAQWQQPINKYNEVVVGATVGLEQKLGADPECMIINTNSLTNVPDTTLFSISNGLSLPMTYGVGVSWNHKNRLLVDFDATMQQWGNIDYPSYEAGSYVLKSGLLKDRYKVNLGADYLPNGMSRNFLERVHYRLGAGYATSYYKVNGQDGPKELSVSAGFGIPLQNGWNLRGNLRPVLNISAQWVHSSATNFITENTFRINIGLTFNERWFAKWKVD
ncbi:MAG: hypothetical protein K2J86_09775 [Prevotella sp.]|nr:hypothetical protein [Prevotella sp.]